MRVGFPTLCANKLELELVERSTHLEERYTPIPVVLHRHRVTSRRRLEQ